MLSPFRWTSDSRTDPGLVRTHNEDAVIDRPDIGLWAVADGMGGHSAGAVASAAIVERLAGIQPQASLSQFVTAVEAAILEVNAHLRDLGRKHVRRTIGSTVAVLILFGAHGACLWAGDSRIYRLRSGKLIQLSQDHALVEDLVEQGFIARESAALHPQANLVTRAVGATDDLKVDMEIFELADHDIFLLSSDGLDKEVSEEDIAGVTEECIRGTNHAPVSEALVDLALSRGARDNVTVASVFIHTASKGKN